MVKVLLIIDDASVGGGQQHVLWLAERLDKEKFIVEVACEGTGYLAEQVTLRGLPFHPLSMANAVNPVTLFHTLRIMRKAKPDIIHTHGGTAGLFGRLAGFLAGVKVLVHTYHGIHYLHYDGWWIRTIYKLADRLLASLTSTVICVAKKDVELALRHGIAKTAKVEIVYNGIDIDRYQRPKCQTGDGQAIVGTIGRLHVQKGHRYLIEAAAKVVARDSNVRFRIIGEGELMTPLRQRVRELQIEENVEFLGSRHDIPEQLATMDVFVLASIWEGMPIVLLEAMAARIPIVATNVDGVSELIVHRQTGFLVDPANATSLARGIETLLTDKTLAYTISANAYKKVNKEFSLQTMVTRIESVYERCLT
jgi:glycosyltransferase involved in cell wall biosynthesis